MQRLGFTVLARNVRTRRGEIDVIAFDDHTLVFVEVKTRRLGRNDSRPAAEERPLAALRPRQRARLRRLAVAWLSERAGWRPAAQTLRFDAIGVLLAADGRLLELEHLEGAW
jgi:putative endonuclease